MFRPLPAARFGDGTMDFRRELIVKPDLESVPVFCRLAQVPESLHFPIFGAVYRSWASTSRVDDTSRAWQVYFSNGSLNYDLKTGVIYVRCVRTGS